MKVYIVRWARPGRESEIDPALGTSTMTEYGYDIVTAHSKQQAISAVLQARPDSKVFRRKVMEVE